MFEDLQKAFEALREALEIGAEYAQQALTEFDNQYRRHPSTEDRRQVIAEGHERIKAQLAYVADLLGALEWVGPVRRSTLFKLGERLSSMLDDDQWNNIEPMLMSLSAACLEKDITQGEWHLARGALSRIAYCDTTQFEPNVAQRFREIAIASLKGMRPWPFDRGEDEIEKIGSVDAAASGEEGAPIVENKDAPGDLAIGDYVFASQWSDCDPCDPWAVGNVTDIGRDFVVIGEVGPRKFPKAMRISQEQGRRIVERYPEMEMNCHSEKWAEIAEVFGSGKEGGAA